MSEIIDIHIKRTQAGTSIPFDKVYLVRKEDQALIPRIFTYALVLPLTTSISDVLFSIRPSLITHKKFHRDDAAKNQLGPALQTPVAPWWAEFNEKYAISSRVVVIPILTSTIKKVVRPRYLTNKKWFTEVPKNRVSSRDVANALSEYTYLSTPHPAPRDRIRPICSICPRMLLHIQGECVPGQPVCYKALNFAEIPEDTDASV